MNLKQLEYFAKVVEAGNMTAAAERLNVAQPALGAQIRRLEQELALELLVRHSRGVSATEAGRRLYERAKSVLAQIDEIRDEMRALGRSSRRAVSLGLVPSMMLLIGPEMLLDLKREMPDVSISVSEERSVVLLDALKAGQFDAIIAYGPSDSGPSTPLLEEDFLFVTAPDRRPEGEAIDFARALERELVIGGRRGVLRQIVEAEARKRSLSLRIALEVQSISSLKALIQRGAGAGIIPYSLAADELERGALCGVRIREPTLTRTLYAVVAPDLKSGEKKREVTRLIERIAAEAIEALGPYGRPCGPG